jgi:hypothetical protein
VIFDYLPLVLLVFAVLLLPGLTRVLFCIFIALHAAQSMTLLLQLFSHASVGIHCGCRCDRMVHTALRENIDILSI